MLINIIILVLALLVSVNEASIGTCKACDNGWGCDIWDCCNTYTCVHTKCSYKEFVLSGAISCEPRLIERMVDSIDGKDIFVQVAKLGLAAAAGFGKGVNVMAMGANVLLDVMFYEEGEELITQADLDDLYNNLLECMDEKVNFVVAADIDSDWKDYRNRYYNIIDEMTKLNESRDTVKLKLNLLEDIVVHSHNVWEVEENWNNINIVAALSTVYSLAINTVYLTSNTYLGFLYDDNDCNAYIETVEDLQDTLDIYWRYISKAYRTFNTDYRPFCGSLYSKYDSDYGYNDGSVTVFTWADGSRDLGPECGDDSYDEASDRLNSEFEEFRYNVIGAVYESTTKLMLSVHTISNNCINSESGHYDLLNSWGIMGDFYHFISSTSIVALGLTNQLMAMVFHGFPVEIFISTYKQYRGYGIEVYQFNMMENISLINQEEYRDNDGLFRFKLISRECDDSVVTNDFSQSTWPTNTNQFFYYNMPGGVSSDCVHERSQFLYLFNPGNKVEVEIYSHGVHSSPRSYINLDGNSVIGTGRGFNIVVLDQDNINIDVFDTFDPYGDGRQRNEQSTDDAMEFLKEISVGRLVIITGWGSVIGLHNDIGMIDSDGDMVRSQRIFNFLNSWGCNVQETNKNRPFIFIGYAGINNVIHCEVGSYEGELEFQYILN